MRQQSTMKQVRDLCRELGVGAQVTVTDVLTRAPWLPPAAVSAALSNLARKYSDLQLAGLVRRQGSGGAPARAYIVTEAILEERRWTSGWSGRHRRTRHAELPRDDLPLERRREVADLLLEAADSFERDRVDEGLERTRQAYFLAREHRRGRS